MTRPNHIDSTWLIRGMAQSRGRKATRVLSWHIEIMLDRNLIIMLERKSGDSFWVIEATGLHQILDFLQSKIGV